MALLSEKKVQLFNSTLTKLMIKLFEEGWNESDEKASYCSFLIDKMHFELDAEMSPYRDLYEVFETVKKNREHELEYRDGLRS